jgi:hypothetical protein
MSTGSEPLETISCAKCGQLNPADRDTCLACEKHLWVLCHACDLPNLRENARCTRCYTIIRPPIVPPLPAYKLQWPYTWVHNPHRRWLIPALAMISGLGIPLAVFIAILGGSLPDLFVQAEKAMFGDIIEAMPMPMPLRAEMTMHLLTIGCFLLVPLSITGFISWLRQPLQRPEQP